VHVQEVLGLEVLGQEGNRGVLLGHGLDLVGV
jgi:hypothetical protein